MLKEEIRKELITTICVTLVKLTIECQINGYFRIMKNTFVISGIILSHNPPACQMQNQWLELIVTKIE